jgi:hypothetical protein
MSRQVFTDNTSYTIRGLTVADVKKWLESFQIGRECDLVDELAADGVSLADLALMCDNTVAQFDCLTGRELQSVVDAAREVNPHFFRVIATVKQGAEAIAREIKAGHLPAIPLV